MLLERGESNLGEQRTTSVEAEGSLLTLEADLGTLQDALAEWEWIQKGDFYDLFEALAKLKETARTTEGQRECERLASLVGELVRTKRGEERDKKIEAFFLAAEKILIRENESGVKRLEILNEIVIRDIS